MAHHSIRTSKSGTSLLFLAALAVVLAASPAFAVSLDLTSATVSQSGELAQICVNLSTEGQLVAGTQNDLIWDETCATLSSKGNCTVSPGLGKQLQSNMPSGDGHPPLRAFVLSLSDVSPIGDTQLYCCTFRSELTRPGTCCNISLSRLGASTPDGKALRTTTTTGAGSPILCLRGNGGASGALERGELRRRLRRRHRRGQHRRLRQRDLEQRHGQRRHGQRSHGQHRHRQHSQGQHRHRQHGHGQHRHGQHGHGKHRHGKHQHGKHRHGKHRRRVRRRVDDRRRLHHRGPGQHRAPSAGRRGKRRRGRCSGGGRRRTAWTGRARQSSRAARGGPRAAGAAAAAVATARRGAG